MFLFAGLIVSFLIWKVYLSVITMLNRKSLCAVPQPPLDSFFYGHEPSITKAKDENRFLDLFVEWVNTYGTTVLFWIGNRPFVFTADPGMLKQCATDLKSFSKVDNLPNRSLFGQKIIGTNSILSGGGLRWAVKRKIMSRFFAKTNMKDMFNAAKEHMNGAELRRWREVVGKGECLDLHDQLSITFSSYLQVLGLSDYLPPETIARNVYLLLEAIPKQLFQRWSYIISADKTKMFALIKKMRSDTKQVVVERMEEMKNNPDNVVPDLDLLGHLIEANLSDDGKTSSSEAKVVDGVVDDVMTVCLVLDNMVKQLCAMFMFLENEQEIQEKLMKELRETEIVDYNDLNKLKYTEKCLLEALRMGPALLRGTRTYKTATNKRFGPYVVNMNNVRVHFSEYVMQMNPEYWPNPKQFNPERWQPGFNPEPFSYMPFFVGSRGCLGKHMAMMMMKLTLSVLAKQFDIQQCFNKKKPPTINQNMAVMRIINKVDCMITPLNGS